MRRPPLLLLLVALAVAPARAGDDAPAERRVRLTYAFRVEPPASATTVEVWAPVPRDVPGQRALDVDVACVTTATVEEGLSVDARTGNRMWRLRAAPAAPVEVTLTCLVAVRGRGAVAQGPADVLDEALAPDRLVPTGGRFAAIARAATAGRATTVERARALFDHVRRAMEYDKTGSGWGRGDAQYACDVGRGNCTDYHSLFLSLARSVGIPARFSIGFPLPAGAEGAIAGYHCWAEFWDDAAERWVPVDISEADKRPERADALFGALEADRVTFSQGRDLALAPPQAGPPLNFFIYPYVEVDGAPAEGVAVDLRVSAREESP